MTDQPFDRRWRVRTTLPERFGQRLRVLARGKLNSALVEFEDGTRHIVNRWSFRKSMEWEGQSGLAVSAWQA